MRDLVTGETRRASKRELWECVRLWRKHKDIRLGSPHTQTTGYSKAKVVWTHHWKRFRAEQKVLARACERCARAGELDVNHLTHERVGEERPEDVLVSCKSCHRALDTLRRREQTPHVQVTVGDGGRVVVWGQR